MKRSIVALLVLAVAVAACAAEAPPPSVAATQPAISSPAGAPSASASAGSGVRPIVFDTDMGMDDLLALYVILRDPALDVRAIAIDGTGLIHCGAGIRNLRRILGAFDRLDIPFGCGREEAGVNGRSFPDEWRAASDDMYGVVLPPVATSEVPPDAVTILHEAATEPVTVLAVGTWTNLQDLFAAHPDDLGRVTGIHAMAGTIDDPGNIELEGTTPADMVEWNVGADPEAFAAVMALDVPVTLVPLDATNDVATPTDIVQLLGADHAAAGADIAFETYLRNPYLAEQGNYWWDAVATVALTDPGLLAWEDMNVAVTTQGSAAGRITREAAGRPVRAAMGADGDRVRAAVLAGLRRGASRAVSFTPVGTIDATWDGTTCRVEGMPAKAGLVLIDFHNRSGVTASLLGAAVREPKTWADAFEYIGALDLSAGEPLIPDWLVPLEGTGGGAEPGEDGTGLATLPSGLVGLMCTYGDWPDVEFIDGGSYTLAE